MPYIASFTTAHKHDFPASSITEFTSNQFTGHPDYQKRLVPKIIVRSLDKGTTYYTFNPFIAGTTNRIVYANVNLSLTHHGTFEFQIEDADKTLNTDNITEGARVSISMGKTAPRMFTHLSGMIRHTGYSRGCDNNLLYNVSGFGTGIRLNERILDVLMDEPRNSAGVVNQSDPNFFANQIVDDALDNSSYYPRGVYPSEVEGTGGYAYINSSGTTVDSPIKDFIPGVVLRFGEISDLFNQIESFTGGRIYVDESDKIQLQPISTPLTQNKGFRITTDIKLDSDLGDTTMYIDQENEYSWSSSISKDDGYANSTFAILAATNAPERDSSNASSFFENKTVEIAQRFKPDTNPNWRIWCGIQGVGLDNVQNENSTRSRWRLCADDNGKPKNTGGIINNKYIYVNADETKGGYSTADGSQQVIRIMGNNANDLDENTWYWFILSSVNATATEYWRWYYTSDTSGESLVMTAPPGTSSSDDGGTGWVAESFKKMVLIQGRFKSEPQNILDPLAVRKRILIENTVPNFPQQIIAKPSAVKYMAGLMYYSSRPKRVFNFPSLTVPNKPVFPGDTACIVDSRFNFSTPGHPVIGGQITDVNHSFGIKGAGNSADSRGQSNMSLSVVAFPGGY